MPTQIFRHTSSTSVSGKSIETWQIGPLDAGEAVPHIPVVVHRKAWIDEVWVRCAMPPTGLSLPLSGVSSLPLSGATSGASSSGASSSEGSEGSMGQPPLGVSDPGGDNTQRLTLYWVADGQTLTNARALGQRMTRDFSLSGLTAHTIQKLTIKESGVGAYGNVVPAGGGIGLSFGDEMTGMVDLIILLVGRYWTF